VEFIEANYSCGGYCTLNKAIGSSRMSDMSIQNQVSSDLTSRCEYKTLDVMVNSDKPEKSWSHLSWPYSWFVKSSLLRKCFCLDDSELDDMKMEASFRDEFRNDMKIHMRGNDMNSVRNTLVDIYANTGYDMSNCRQQVMNLAEPLVEVHDRPESVPGKISILKRAEAASMASEVAGDQKRVRVVPRFVASVTFALRAKFGRLACTEANRLLIEREYLRVCRDSNVRHVDVAHHHQFVLNTYFNETLMDEIADVRVRIPAWLRAAFGRKPRAAPTVC